MAEVININYSRRKRKEVDDHSVNADRILLRLYRRGIDQIYCMDCINRCDKRGTAHCWWNFVSVK